MRGKASRGLVERCSRRLKASRDTAHAHNATDEYGAGGSIALSRIPISLAIVALLLRTLSGR
jgi:hypothetical protein